MKKGGWWGLLRRKGVTEARSIGKFNGSENAEEFIRNVNEYKRPEDNLIKRVGIVSGQDFSVPIVLPSIFFVLFLI